MKQKLGQDMIVSYKYTYLINTMERQGLSKLNMFVQDQKNVKISHGYIFPANEKNVSNH